MKTLSLAATAAAALALATITTTTSAFRLPAPAPAAVVPPSSPLFGRKHATTARPAAAAALGLGWGRRRGGGGMTELRGAAAASEDPNASLNKWDPQVWIAPAVHNRLSVRLLAILAGVGVAMKQTGTPIPRKLAAFVHLLSFGANLGAQLYTTFVLGIVAIKALPRQMFGKMQSKLFPIYFAWSAVCIALQMLTGGVVGLAAPAMKWLAVSMAATLLNILYLEPRSTDIMFKRYKLENDNQRDTAEYKGLAKQFGKFHGLSSLVNLVALVGAIVQGYYLTMLLA